MKRLFQHPWGWASLAPLACAVHCAVTPILVVAAPAFAPAPILEWILLAATTVVVGVALFWGVRIHGRWTPFLLIGIGLLVWCASLLHLFHPLPEDLTTVIASLTVATGLVWNSRLHCGSKSVACAACALDESEATSLSAGPAPARAAPSEAPSNVT